MYSPIMKMSDPYRNTNLRHTEPYRKIFHLYWRSISHIATKKFVLTLWVYEHCLSVAKKHKKVGSTLTLLYENLYISYIGSSRTQAPNTSTAQKLGPAYLCRAQRTYKLWAWVAHSSLQLIELSMSHSGSQNSIILKLYETYTNK